MKLISHVIAVALSAGVAIAQATPPEPQISATGRGEVRVKPTRAVISLTVQGKAVTAAQAAAENSRLVASTMRSLGGAGVKEDEISNSAYSVVPDYEFSSSGRKQIGFVASNVIRVEISNIANVGKVIDAGLSGGATLVASAQYSGDRMEEAQRHALRTAVENARRDAEAMAQAAGGSLGRMIFLTSTGSPGPMSREMAMEGAIAAAGMAAPTSVRPSELTIVASANGRWEFVPRK